MIPKNNNLNISQIVNEWVNYIEIFSSSSICISDLQSKGYSLDEIGTLFKQAIKDRQEIQL